MPVIPTVTSPEQVSIPQINPGMAGAAGQALARGEAQLSNAADIGEQVAQRMQRAQDDGILLDAENKIAADMEKAHAGLATWTDYTHADELKNQTADDLKERYAKQYGDRPDLWRHIEPYLGQELNAYNRTVDVRAADLTAHFNAAALTDSNLRSINAAALEPTMDGKEKIWAEQDAKIDAMVKNGSIWADQGEAQKKLNRTRTITTEVDHAANPLNPPEVMAAELERLKGYEGKGYVDPESMAALQDRLGRAYEVATNRAENHAIQGKVDAAAGQLSTIYGKDFASQLTALSDPEMQKTLGLVDKDGHPDTKAINETRVYLKGQDSELKLADSERDQKILDHLTPDVLSGKLTESGIARMANQPEGTPNWIPPRVADHLRAQAAQIARENRAESTQERALARQEAAEQSLELVARLGSESGYLTKDDIPVLMHDNPGLKYSDALHVVEMRSTAADPFFRTAMDLFEEAKKNHIISLADYGKAQLALLQAAKSGKTGADLIKFASGILQPQIQKQIGQRLDKLVGSGTGPASEQR